MAHRLQWTGPRSNTDGSVFDQSQYAGYELELDGRPAVSIPVGWDTDNVYEFDLRSLGPDLFPYGSHSARLRVVNRAGRVSDFSNAVAFEHVDERVPAPPLDLVAI